MSNTNLGDHSDEIADDEHYGQQGVQYLHDETEGGTRGFGLEADQQDYDENEPEEEMSLEQGDDIDSTDFQDQQFGSNDSYNITGSNGNDDQETDEDNENPNYTAANQETGQEADPKGGKGKDDTSGPPPEGWFRWLEKTWKKLASHQTTSALCKPINTSVREGIGAASAGIAYALALYPGYMTDTIGALFNLLNDLENPLFYSGLIMASAGPFLGFPGVFIYSALQPVQMMRRIIDLVLKFPTINMLLKAVKKAADALENVSSQSGNGSFKRLSQAAKGDIKGSIKGAIGDAKQNIKDRAQNAANSVRNAPRNAANAIRDKAQNASSAVNNFFNRGGTQGAPA